MVSKSSKTSTSSSTTTSYVPPVATTPTLTTSSTPTTSTTSTSKTHTGTRTRTSGKGSQHAGTHTTKTSTSRQPHSTHSSGSGADLPLTLSSNDASLSTGAIAGIAVGCAAVGAIVAALLVFFIMRRKMRRSQPPEPRYAPILAAAPGKSPSDSEKGAYSVDSPATLARAGAVEELLPQPAETKLLAGELSKLQMLIRNHVSNFYSDQYIEPARLAGMINPEALSEVAAGTPLSTSMWIELLANTATRRTAIHYALSWTILSRIQPSALDISKTLLPLTVVGCLQAMNGPSNSNRDSEYLKSRWHALTAMLQRDKYVGHPFTEDDDRNENIENAMVTLDAVLRPLADPVNATARASNLDHILKAAASFGLILISEPVAWGFNWSPPKNSAPSQLLIVFPTLVQYADENGHPVHRPLEIGEREMAHNISLP